MHRMGLLSVVSCALLMGCDSDTKPDTFTPDVDNDGFEAPEDCNDEDALIHPDAGEICDGIDNNCNGDVDEGDAVGAVTWFADVDDDGFGDAASQATACSQPDGYTALPTDCDDANPDAFPGNDEVCDFADNDCDGSVDEGTALDAETYYADADGDGYGSPYDAQIGCTQPTGYVSNSGDCDDRDAGLNPGATEVCDGDDNDCDGLFDDEDDSLSDGADYYPDRDNDGYGDPDGIAVYACDTPIGYDDDDDDCNDDDSGTNPGAVEVCGDGVDNNCSTVIDEATAPYPILWYIDDDGDGFGDPDSSPIEACAQPAGRVSNDDDCDDDDANIYPEAVEIWYDGTDQDCAGDDDYDADGDGFSSDAYKGGEDCDDTTDAVWPGHPDVCSDGLDNDCDGITDPCSIGATLLGTAAGDRLGESISSIGDFDGDGFDDFAVSASRTSTTGSAEGAVYVLTGVVSGVGAASASASATFTGANSYDFLGPVAGIGDIDGDGYDDIAMGATGYDSATTDVGTVYIHYGPEFGAIGLGTGADVVMYGERIYDYAANAVSRAGDFDGDGVDDTLVGAMFYDDGSTANTGAAYLILGEPAFSGVSLGYADVTFVGTSASEWSGASVSGGGDLNNDGYDDLIIGAPYLLDDSGNNVGGAWVVYGESSPSATVSLSDADARLLGESNASLAGMSVFLAEDLNNDGNADLIIGAPEQDTTGSLSGAAYVVHGPISGDLDLADADAVLSAESRHDYFGVSVSTAGDINNDGTPDLLIGASKEDSGGSDAGAAYIMLGPLTGAVDAADTDAKLLGEAGSDWAGAAVAPIGDVTGDGIDDLLVGAPYSDAGGLTDGGAVWLIPGDSW